MVDYAKKTVVELQEVLKSRGLPSSGKKAELVARLNESDKQAVEPEEVLAAPESNPIPTSVPSQPVTATATAEAAPTTQPVASGLESTSTDPTSTAGPATAITADNPSPDTALATQTNYSLNLPTSSLDSELAKRKARAERFGIPAAAAAPEPPADGETSTASGVAEEPTQDAAALKNLERAKRFGTGQTAIGKLDEALPSEGARSSRKRGHAQVAESSELDDPGLKRNFANRGRGRGGRLGGRHQGGGGGGGGGGGRSAGGVAALSKPQGIQKAPPAYTTEKDKLAAEARKKKFATA